MSYVCNNCGAKAYYDGRCGDGPVLTCGCDRRGSQWIPDRGGGYYSNPTGAKPVKQEDSRWSAESTAWAGVADRR